MITLSPFWTDEYPRPADLPVTGLPSHTQVAIVGSGVTGLNAARALAAAGVDVTVLDAGPVGNGASTVNGGMLNYGLKAATTKVYKQFGPELGREFWDASLASIDHVAEVVASEGIECFLVRHGAAELAYEDRVFEGFRHEAAWMQEHLDFSVDLVEADAIDTVVGGGSFRGAMIDHVGAGLQPARYVYGLATALGGRGVHLVENAEVTNISRNTGGYQLLTAKGKLGADAVLLATNGYTGMRPVPSLRRKVVPVGSYIVVTEPLPEETVTRLIPDDRMLWTARRFLNYFRRTHDNRILMGGRQRLATDLDLTESAERLRRTTVEVFPELEHVAVTHSWTGKLGITFDLMPHIGQINGMWYALGYGGHGLGIGSYVGNEVGRRIAGELDRSPFEEIPHPTRPYYRGRPWFLPVAAQWYRLLDSVGL